MWLSIRPGSARPALQVDDAWCAGRRAAGRPRSAPTAAKRPSLIGDRAGPRAAAGSRVVILPLKRIRSAGCVHGLLAVGADRVAAEAARRARHMRPSPPGGVEARSRRSREVLASGRLSRAGATGRTQRRWNAGTAGSPGERTLRRRPRSSALPDVQALGITRSAAVRGVLRLRPLAPNMVLA